ncbi:LapA family protein [Taylorella equigenitalis]|uniref:Membrane protein n=2 Tax=Taylorella equigenitalis TaxID=29575 RepID=A0ABM5N9M1_9BURK|nr:LapA family protein [Taylorella equigenitalis]AFN35649.1 putative membrane protein [Taylorella equigenitalis ATCC 35865]ASY30299.1 hypothetical protein B9Z30_02705 [Taylorella equigenitalis]ASY37602.1 DUF1049 domain-containing protein [Taylorella equigenitalis]ASY39071.1 hypothetical protein CA604_02805 [Taylorella equigenitalis]ASY40591.1 hypothetical protein CAV20_02635 [Taylorella equigenitalis]
MRIVIWAIRIILFVLVILLAIKNTAPVDINFYGNLSLKAVPLIVVILASFIIGGVFIYLLTLPSKFSNGIELNRLRKENQLLKSDLEYTHKNEKILPVAPPDGFVVTEKVR